MKNLIKLTGKSDHNLSNDLKDLRLEHLEYNYCGTNHISLEFLRHLVNLKFLRLFIPFFSNEIFKMICDLKDLKILELDGLEGCDNSGLNNLNKLEKLKRLKVSNGLSWNVLDHLKFGVFNDLEELDASFSGPSVESLMEMKRITPTLKKIVICDYRFSKTINTLLETLENLEAVKIQGDDWMMCEKMHPQMKYLEVSCHFKFKLYIDKFSKKFPNLEYLKIDRCFIERPESFFITLLSELKQLKKLHMQVQSYTGLVPETALQCLQVSCCKRPKLFFGFPICRLLEILLSRND